jgi:hypothetical protein
MKPAALAAGTLHRSCCSAGTGANPSRTCVAIVGKSGKKVPTAVQKVYLTLGKNVHELTDKFFIQRFFGRKFPPTAPTLVTNVLIE